MPPSFRGLISPVHSVVPAIRSLTAFVAVSLYVLLVGTPFVLFAIAIRQPRDPLHGRTPRRAAWPPAERDHRIASKAASTSSAHRAAVYAVNHASNVEPPILFDALHELFPRLRILYKAELRKLPVLVRAFDLAGFVPLERGNPEQSLPAIDRAARSARAPATRS